MDLSFTNLDKIYAVFILLLLLSIYLPLDKKNLIEVTPKWKNHIST